MPSARRRQRRRIGDRSGRRHGRRRHGDDDDAVDAVVPPSSTKDEDAYVLAVCHFPHMAFEFDTNNLHDAVDQLRAFSIAKFIHNLKLKDWTSIKLIHKRLV